NEPEDRRFIGVPRHVGSDGNAKAVVCHGYFEPHRQQDRQAQDRNATHSHSHGTAPHARDESTSDHYWITSSARASTAGGIVSPSALAVLRLMTSCKVVDCTTARSPGRVPLRTRPVYTPT